jgi:outer membrane receptor protein involved in Fe transport
MILGPLAACGVAEARRPASARRAGTRRIRAVACAVALSTSPTLAAAASLTARFVEAPGDAPLAAVELVARRAADSTVVAHGASGADGRVRLDGLAEGSYRLRASLLGHVTWTRADVVLAPGVPQLDLGTVALAIAPVSIGGVTTTTERPLVTIAADRTIYYAKDQPVATAGTATDLLRTVPELDVDIDGHVSLRGGSGVGFQFNGRTAPLSGEALTQYLRQTSAKRIERIEVIPNPSARYTPEGSAGIVNIVFKDKAELGLSGSLMFNGGSAWNGPGARLAWQRGPVTLFGGAYGALGSPSLYEYSSAREDLVPHALDGYRSQTLTRSHDGRYASYDASVDCALAKHVTLYGSVYGYPYSGRSDATSQVLVTDSTGAPTSVYASGNASYTDSRWGSWTVGLQHAVESGRDERTVEYLQSLNGWSSDNQSLQRTSVPTGLADLGSRRTDASGNATRSLEADDTQPLGKLGKLESGLHLSERVATESGALAYTQDGVPVVTPLTGAIDVAHHERFASVYVTASNTFGRFSLQLGARAELAHTTLDARVSARSFTYDYRSLFPSANAAWDFGHGASLRASYSRRIERPSLFMLDPDALTPDSLNRSVGNPDLGPRYTNSWSADASWSGPRGLLRLSPYYRRTVDNWERWTTVVANGSALTTWINASSVSAWGVTVIGSLRQVKRLGGTLTLNLYRERHDAGNAATPLERTGTSVSLNGNGTYEATKWLALQAYVRMSPAQTTAQGRTSAFAYTMLGGRLKRGEKLTLSVWARDPFNLAHSSGTSGDATYTASWSSNVRGRGFSATLLWLWGGKPPQQKRRLQSGEAPSPGETPGP